MAKTLRCAQGDMPLFCMLGTPAKQYYSDAFPVYDTLYYGAPYEMCTDKQETFSVEAVNADLRHYLKRLARKSRCFSRRMQALVKNIQLWERYGFSV